MESTRKIFGKNDELAEKIETAKTRENDKQEIILAASRELLENCNLVKERASIAKSIIQAASKELVELYRNLKKCPLLPNPLWACDKLGSITLKKGQEPFCHNENFLDCPAFNHYFMYKMAEIHAKMKATMKKKKEQKENSHR